MQCKSAVVFAGLLVMVAGMLAGCSKEALPPAARNPSSLVVAPVQASPKPVGAATPPPPPNPEFYYVIVREVSKAKFGDQVKKVGEGDRGWQVLDRKAKCTVPEYDLVSDQKVVSGMERNRIRPNKIHYFILGGDGILRMGGSEETLEMGGGGQVGIEYSKGDAIRFKIADGNQSTINGSSVGVFDGKGKPFREYAPNFLYYCIRGGGTPRFVPVSLRDGTVKR